MIYFWKHFKTYQRVREYLEGLVMWTEKGTENFADHGKTIESISTSLGYGAGTSSTQSLLRR